MTQRHGLRGLAADYKMDAIVFEFSPNGTYYRAWKCVGCFPAAVNYGELSNENDGYKNITVTLRYDYAYRYDEATVEASNTDSSDWSNSELAKDYNT